MNFPNILRRSISRMAPSRDPITARAVASSSQYVGCVIRAMQRLYPEEIADKSFDNTGLLLEAPHIPGKNKNSALLTIDLTQAVAEEAIDKRVSIIITYHPIIFRGLKALTLGNTQQTTLLRLAQEGISVYSPHTAVDAAHKGLNSFIAHICTGAMFRNVTEANVEKYFYQFPGAAKIWDAKTFETIPAAITVINPCKTVPQGHEASKIGYGRIVTFEKPQSLGSIIDKISLGLSLPTLSVAVPIDCPIAKSNIEIRSIGICAGSGSSILNGLDADLLLTGELDHHSTLAAIENGQCVITTFHSNSERAFLERYMKEDLQAAIVHEAQILHDSGAWGYDGEAKRLETVKVSQVDRDPFETVLLPRRQGW